MMMVVSHDLPMLRTCVFCDAQAENRRDKAQARGLTGGILVDLSHSSRTELRARKRITKCAQCLHSSPRGHAWTALEFA